MRMTIVSQTSASDWLKDVRGFYTVGLWVAAKSTIEIVLVRRWGVKDDD